MLIVSQGQKRSRSSSSRSKRRRRSSRTDPNHLLSLTKGAPRTGTSGLGLWICTFGYTVYCPCLQGSFSCRCSVAPASLARVAAEKEVRTCPGAAAGGAQGPGGAPEARTAALAVRKERSSSWPPWDVPFSDMGIMQFPNNEVTHTWDDAVPPWKLWRNG